MNNKISLVVGASENENRYSNRAVKLLGRYNHEVRAYGLRSGNIDGVEIATDFPQESIDTVTMYVGPNNQSSLYDSIINLKPRRVIFNPGTENEVFKRMLLSNGIDVVENCTLVMLNSGIF
jgi:predicted CoA-binding protein